MSTGVRGVLAALHGGESPSMAVAFDPAFPTVNGQCRNDRVARTRGLSDAQLNKLALTYIAASVRAKVWLIPAYHVAIDDGISDGHDDPQHFDLARWGSVVCSYLGRMGKACS